AGWRREGSPAAYVYEVATGRPAAPPLDGDGLLIDAALRADGRGAATLHSAASSDEQRFSRLVEPEGRAGCLQLWDWREGKRRFAALPMPSEPRGVTFAPDGKRVVVICGGGQVQVIDPTTGKVTLRLEHGFERSSSNTYPGVRFTPDGQSLVTLGPGPAGEGWDPVQREPRLCAADARRTGAGRRALGGPPTPRDRQPRCHGARLGAGHRQARVRAAAPPRLGFHGPFQPGRPAGVDRVP